jgi:hypothetical protein
MSIFTYSRRDEGHRFGFDVKEEKKQNGVVNPIELNNQVVGNVGLFYVCYRLSRLGWNVMPTARNARGVATC